MKKRPPKPFYGPEDYYPGMDVAFYSQEIDDEIRLWHSDYRKLSLLDKIRLSFSDQGCVVRL